jgi:hypothetical protein
MAVNVSRRMSRIKWILRTSLLKTLASKLQCRVPAIRRKYQVVIPALEGGTQKVLRVVIDRPGKDPLVATFGGIPFTRVPDGMGTTDFYFEKAWYALDSNKSEVVPPVGREMRTVRSRRNSSGSPSCPQARRHRPTRPTTEGYLGKDHVGSEEKDAGGL